MYRWAEATRMKLRIDAERWPYRVPFRTAGYVREAIEVIVVSLEQDGRVGRGEAAGVRYRRETVGSMTAQIEAVRADLERGVSREALLSLLPSGGARNAVDCALWDLEAKLNQRPAWHTAGVGPPRPVPTVFTCGAETPERMAADACNYTGARAIKVKLTGDPLDLARVAAVRAARPDVWLSIDANQGLTRPAFDRLMPVLADNRVSLIEQPFPAGEDTLLDGLRSPIPIAADESVQDRSDIPALVGRVQMINIKLDKCGGLTEGLAMAHLARSLGLDVMVGNMGNTSLAMAPAVLLGQLCQVNDLDGPLFIVGDRQPSVTYNEGRIVCPEALWGGI